MPKVSRLLGLLLVPLVACGSQSPPAEPTTTPPPAKPQSSAPTPSPSSAPSTLACELSFATTSWSTIYEHTSGTGTVTCDDGSSLQVAISAKGLGVSAGAWRIENGSGRFTPVAAIDHLLGNYLSISGEAGLVKAAAAEAMTKGDVSLMLTGTGEGFDIGIAIKDFRIERAEVPPLDRETDPYDEIDRDMRSEDVLQD